MSWSERGLKICATLLVGLLGSAGCSSPLPPRETPPVSSSTEEPFSVLSQEREDFDVPPPGFADPQMETEESSWRLARSSEDIAVYLGKAGNDYCYLIIETGIGTQSCDDASDGQPLTLLSETPDGRGTLLYAVVQDTYRALRIGETTCMVANNVVIMQNPPLSVSRIELLDDQGDTRVEAVPPNESEQNADLKPVCL